MAKHRRGRGATQTAVTSLPLSLDRTYLLTSESAGHMAVGGLTLVLDELGLTVLTPHGTTATVLTWAELTALRTDGPTTAPGGEDAVLLEASSAARTHRFAVPTDDAALLESTIAKVTGVPAPTPARRTRRRR